MRRRVVWGAPVSPATGGNGDGEESDLHDEESCHEVAMLANGAIYLWLGEEPAALLC